MIHHTASYGLRLPFSPAGYFYQQITVSRVADAPTIDGADSKSVINGVPKLSERLSKSDDVLLGHIKNGFQSEWSPMAMPVKGGNQDLTNSDLESVLDYMRKNFSKLVSIIQVINYGLSDRQHWPLVLWTIYMYR